MFIDPPSRIEQLGLFLALTALLALVAYRLL